MGTSQIEFGQLFHVGIRHVDLSPAATTLALRYWG